MAKKPKSWITVNAMLPQRAQKLALEELFSWAEVALSEVGRYFSAYRMNRDPEVLEEAKLNVEGLYAVLEELTHRRPGVVVAQNRTRQVKSKMSRRVT